MAAFAMTVSGAALADPDLDQKMSNPGNWVTQAGDYANHRWSDLKEINASNVSELQVAWTLSTGVLRGHEGSPLVIGDTMYIHTPFPNNVYAVNLKDQCLCRGDGLRRCLARKPASHGIEACRMACVQAFAQAQARLLHHFGE